MYSRDEPSTDTLARPLAGTSDNPHPALVVSASSGVGSVGVPWLELELGCGSPPPPSAGCCDADGPSLSLPEPALAEGSAIGPSVSSSVLVLAGSEAIGAAFDAVTEAVTLGTTGIEFTLVGALVVLEGVDEGCWPVAEGVDEGCWPVAEGVDTTGTVVTISLPASSLLQLVIKVNATRRRATAPSIVLLPRVAAETGAWGRHSG